MKKYIAMLLITIVLVFVVTSCGGNNRNTTSTNSQTNITTGTTVNEDPQQEPTTKLVNNVRTPIKDDGTGVLQFGMSVSDFKNVINQKGWNVDFRGSDDSAKIYYDENYLDGGSYEFDANGNLKQISTNGSNIMTSKGLKVNDSVDRLRKLYGEPNNHTVGSENYPGEYFWYYLTSKITLEVEAHNGIVTYWGLKSS
jgi:hypothetical protein